MANQFITGQGQGYDPLQDPSKRTLASGVNAGQGLPNMDPAKAGNPYAQAAETSAQNIARPPVSPSATPVDPTAGNPYAQPAPGGARAGRTAPAPPPTPTPVPSQAMGQPPNPYIAAARTAQNVVQPPPTQQQVARTAAGVAPDAQATPMNNGQWSPSLSSNYVAPGQNYTTFDPSGYNAYKGLLASEAAGNLSPSQVIANKQNFASDYYDQGMAAANHSAGAGLTGDSGVSRQMQQTIAGNIARAQTNANAQLQQNAQDKLGSLEQGDLANMQFAQGLGLSQDELAQNAQAAFNNTQATLAGQANQANISQNEINARRNQPFWNVASDIGKNLVGAGIKALPFI